MKRISLLILFLLILLLPIGSAAAQDEPITVISDDLTLDFPSEITFALSFESATTIETINLYYGTERRTCTGQARVRVDFDPAASGEVTWDWDLGDSGDLPPGAVIHWHWLLTDVDGNQFETEEKTFQYEDPNYDWQSIHQDDVTIVWAEGSTDFAWAMHAQMMKAIERLEENAGIGPDGPVRLTVYPSSDAMVEASVHMPEWAGGVAYTDYNLIVAGIQPTSFDWAAEVIAHEMGHLVSHTLIFNCVGTRMPTWLDEGISVYTEGPIKESDIQLVTRKLESDDLPTLRSLAQGFAADAESAHLSYAQSGMVVNYMIQTFGQEKFAELLTAIRDGNKIDAALALVYGLNTEGIDSEFRIALGFAPLPGYDPNATATPKIEDTAVPTMALVSPLESGEEEDEEPTAEPTPTATLTTPTPTRQEPVQPTPKTTETPEKSGPEIANLALIGIILAAGLGGLAVIIIVIVILSRKKKKQ